MLDRELADRAIDAAFSSHLDTLFGAAVRHLQAADVESARRELRKGLAIARQVHNEMSLIVDETLERL